MNEINNKLDTLDNLTQEERYNFLFKDFLEQHGELIFKKFVCTFPYLDYLSYFLCLANYLLDTVPISTGVYETLIFQIKRDGPKDLLEGINEFEKKEKNIFEILSDIINDLTENSQLLYWERVLSIYTFVEAQKEVNELEKTIKLG